jgi:hypothetical protein
MAVLPGINDPKSRYPARDPVNQGTYRARLGSKAGTEAGAAAGVAHMGKPQGEHDDADATIDGRQPF